MDSKRWFIYVLGLVAVLVVSGQSSAGITGFKAAGHDSRIDLVWDRDEQAAGYSDKHSYGLVAQMAFLKVFLVFYNFPG
ncbi:MAG: hypothetical protein GY845_18690 [Planctomycetes bacterium]|nr:hypothetical protein [Planctomycetota bacterium]